MTEQIAKTGEDVSQQSRKEVKFEKNGVSFASVFENLFTRQDLSMDPMSFDVDVEVENPVQEEARQERGVSQEKDVASNEEEVRAVATENKKEVVREDVRIKGSPKVATAEKEVETSEQNVGMESGKHASKEEIGRVSEKLVPAQESVDAIQTLSKEGSKNEAEQIVVNSDLKNNQGVQSEVERSLLKEDKTAVDVKVGKPEVREVRTDVGEVSDVVSGEKAAVLSAERGSAPKLSSRAEQVLQSLFGQVVSTNASQNGFSGNESFSGQGFGKESGVLLANNESGRVQGKARGGSKMTELVRANQEKIIARIQDAFDNMVKGRFGNQMVVRLDPPSLGKVTVKITQRADQLFARVSPESPEVEAVLRNKVSELSSVLAQSGIKVENIHVSVGEEVIAQHDFGEVLEENLPDRGMQQGSQHAPAFHDSGESDSISNGADVVGGWVA